MIHASKATSSVVFSVCDRIVQPSTQPILEHFHHSQRNPVPIAIIPHLPPTPPALGSFLLYGVACWTSPINGILQYMALGVRCFHSARCFQG